MDAGEPVALGGRQHGVALRVVGCLDGVAHPARELVEVTAKVGEGCGVIKDGEVDALQAGWVARRAVGEGVRKLRVDARDLAVAVVGAVVAAAVGLRGAQPLGHLAGGAGAAVGAGGQRVGVDVGGPWLTGLTAAVGERGAGLCLRRAVRADGAFVALGERVLVLIVVVLGAP